MADSIQVQIEKMRASITTLESQRGILGDETVSLAIKALQQQLSTLEQQAATQAAPTEERRLVTILFIDMVGSTSLAEKLDPEEYRQIVASLHTTLGKFITAHHGTVVQYLGDGLLAIFGSQQASEHDPENAIRAALDGQSAVANLPMPEKVQLRLGIHTGLVVLGELGDAAHKEFTASGDAMNLAARLQSAAPPGGILISHDTYRYVRGVFDLTPRPPLTVKGKGESLQTYLVRRARPRPFRSLSRGVAGVETRTIGREAEMHSLRSSYLRAYEGHGTVWAQLVSDPGVGKSRLLLDLSDWIDLREENTWLLRARAFPDDANQPFALVRRLWFDRFQIAEDTPLEQAEKKWVERFKELYGQVDYEEAAHALGILVGLPFEKSPYIKGMRTDPTQVKGRALVVSRDLVRAVRQKFPLVVLLEDLQWTDLASWDYLMEVFLNKTTASHLAGLFVLAAARPEWHPPRELLELFESSASVDKTSETWGTLISLAPLTDQSEHELVMELFQRTLDVPQVVIDLLVERSEGVPYFTEEMVNWFIDHDVLDAHSEPWRFFNEKLKEQPFPATLQHLLLTRLSSLSQPERDALQRGSIFGRRFWTTGVEALEVPSAAQVLGHLQLRGFVDVQPESAFQGDTEWSFHHNLLQEVTYESVLKRDRARLHSLAAEWLEKQARHAGRLDEFSGLLGEHTARAGELSAAVDWYLQAGKRSFHQGAVREARDFYTRALELLPPVDRIRRWQALLGREEANSMLSEAEQWGADITALLELARTFEDENYLAEAQFRQAIYGTRIADITISDPASNQAQETARRCGNEILEIKALALRAIVEVAKHEITSGTEHIEEALFRARSSGDDDVLSYVLSKAAFYYGEVWNFEKWYPLNQEQIELDHRLGNRYQEAKGLGNLGINYIACGLFKQGRALVERSMEIYKAIGARRVLAYDLLNLGWMHLETGDLRQALRLTEQALHEISPSQDARGKAFILINLGYVLVAMGAPSDACRRFEEARQIAISRSTPAIICESTAGLAACAIMQGQLDDARKLVHAAWDYLKEYGWIGTTTPGSVYRYCAETFDALGEVENFKAVVDAGYQALLEVVDKRNIATWRQSFLENVPDHRWMVEMWERINQ